MTTGTHSQLASFIWSICNLLRGPYKRNEYRRVKSHVVKTICDPACGTGGMLSVAEKCIRDLNRDVTVIKVGDEVALQYYRLERIISSGAIDLREGDPQYIKSPTEVGTGKAQDEKVPLSEIIQVLNERFGTQFSEEDRLFFQQIKEKACRSQQVIQTALANPLDKFQLGIRKLIEDLMIERMSENDKIVTRYMADRDFQGLAFPILAREIFEAVLEGNKPATAEATAP